MSQPVKLPVLIAVCAAALVLFGLIGYKFIASSNPPVRTDAAARDIIASYANARAQKQANGKGTMPPPAPTHP